MINDRNGDTISFPPQRSGRGRAGLLLVSRARRAAVRRRHRARVLRGRALVRFARLLAGFLEDPRASGLILVAAGAATFIAVYGAFLALKPARFGEIGSDGVIIINDRPVRLPVGPVLSIIAVLLAAIVALGTAVGLMSEWPTIALWWHGKDVIVSGARTSIPSSAGRSRFICSPFPHGSSRPAGCCVWPCSRSGWACSFSWPPAGPASCRAAPCSERTPSDARARCRVRFLLAAIAVKVYLGRFERLFEDHAILPV